MATLTYDPTEQVEGELSEEEKDSLEVGEKMAEQQDQMLAGKFKTAEDLEQGYIELQKKLGGPKEESTEPEEKPEAKEEEVKEEKEVDEDVDTAFLDTLWDEANKEWTDDTLNKLGEMSARDIAQMHLKYRAENEPQQSELTEENVKDLKQVAGGESEYTQMMQWANSALSENEIKMYDAVMDQGNPLAAFFAVQALNSRYKDASGVDGQLLTGKAPKNEGDAFKSQAQVVKAMSDPQYEKAPAYRQAIYDKLERSNINF